MQGRGLRSCKARTRTALQSFGSLEIPKNVLSAASVTPITIVGSIACVPMLNMTNRSVSTWDLRLRAKIPQEKHRVQLVSNV